MDWQEIHRQLRESLHGEVRKSWGRIAEIESVLCCSEGYLNKLCSGRNEFKLDFFLRTIAVLGLDHRAFFSRALGIHPQSKDYLKELEDPGDHDQALTKIVRATRELEASEPAPARPATKRGAKLVAKLVSRPRGEQLRSLRRSLKYRDHAFARAYLQHLDTLRYDDAVGAAKLATGVAVHLLPALPGPQSERLSMQCLALGVFGSARRLKGGFAAAACTFGLALELSRRHQLHRETGDLLLRASYLLKDFGHFERALLLLNEALVIFVRLGSPWDVGRALVDHGMMSCYAGDYEAAVLDLQQALSHLEDGSGELSRNRLAAYQFLAYAHEQLDDLDAAEDCLATGTKVFGPSHAVDRAKLQWLWSSLAFRRGDYRRSEKLLRVVHEVLASHENALQEGVVLLDLLRSLLAQGKNQEAVDLATGMPHLLMKFRDNRFAKAAIVELVNAALAGQLNEKTVREARAKLEKEGTLARDPLERARGSCCAQQGAPLSR